MFTTPSRFNKYLKENDLVNEIYDAMESDDYADVVFAALKSLVKGNIKLHAHRENKNLTLSDSYRNEGNAAFKEGKTVQAMLCYNKALRFAPNKSRALLLAYSNRSAVLYTVEHFVECLLDIETCFRLGCPADIVDKLNKRKESATAKLAQKRTPAETQSPYKKFSQIDNRHAEVPCASADVEIVVKDGAAKITAAKDIKVGTVLAAESCYVASNNYKLSNVAAICRYCFIKCFNAIPCDSCCFIMFCSEKCKRKCDREYHSIECYFMEVIEATDFSPRTMLMVAGTFKFIHMCDTWKEAIAESYCTGSKRRRVSTASQMFDVDNKLSILNFEEDNIFVYGNMYENSFVCAKILDTLEKIPSYLPRSPSERVLAKRAIARIMMYLALYAKPTQVVVVEQPTSSEKPTVPVKLMYHGLFPFIGKLQNSCTPNTIVSNAIDKNVLIALQPISKGSELTASLMGHYLETNLTWQERTIESMIMYGWVCNCFICSGEWQTRRDTLTEEQLDAYEKCMAVVRSVSRPLPFQNFSTICDTIACLSSAPFTQEYIDIFKEFRGLIVFGPFYKSAKRKCEI